MFLAGVGWGMLLALGTGLADKHATNTGRVVRETGARLPTIKEGRTGARVKAGAWVTAAVGFLVVLAFSQASE
jgi:hypothetical protein